ITLILPLGLYSQTQNENNNINNEITIFVIPSVAPIDWSNPAMLYKTTLNSYIKSIFRKNYYAIGHTIARVSSPMLPAPRFFAMSGKVFTEKPILVLVKKNGLGALGMTMQGHVESEMNIIRSLKLYSGRNMVAYIKFRVPHEAIIRVLEFLEQFQKKTIHGLAPGDLYNGATWPRYRNEGSGCSAFGVSILDVANLLPAESGEWRMHVKIPINLIGGEMNKSKKVKLSTILKTKSWYEGAGLVDVDYVDYNVFDPSLIFQWIKNKQIQNDSDFQLENENGMSGLIVDKRSLVYGTDDSVFQQRKDSGLFVKQYYRSLQSMK
ncbi:MAG TPA: hypothetical protein VFK73_00250, partial [Paludibacter sp.]|nr:hypothetical protein [Paludibacter sp.]